MTSIDTKTGRFVKKALGYKKKTCTCCGRYLWLHDFGKRRNRKNFPDGYDCRCKECRRKEGRDRYAREKKVPDGLKMNSQGIVVDHKGASSRIYWNNDKIEKFKKEYPFTLNEELAIDYEVSIRTIVRRAREMGLEKNPEWLSKIWDERRKMAQRVNRACGNKADLTNFIEGGKKHQFQKGHAPLVSTETRKKAWVTRKHNKLRKQLAESRTNKQTV